MTSVDITIPEAGRFLLPGMSVGGSVAWRSDRPVDRLAVRLIHYTEGKGTRDVEVVAEEEWVSPGDAGERAFSFSLPDSPYSFSGSLISLIWAVEAVAWPGEATARVPFEMSPSGQEIILPPPVE